MGISNDVQVSGYEGRIAGKIVEGLRDDALTVAMDMGYEALATDEGRAKLMRHLLGTAWSHLAFCAMIKSDQN